MTFVWLLLLVPLPPLLHYGLHAPPAWVFASAVLAVVPLAEWIRRATEQLARIAGSAVGGLLNVTFGNLAELILAIFVLAAGNQAVVKAQITGSIIGNGLLGLGLAIVFGAAGRQRQRFDRERSGLLSSLLMLAVVALMVPALFDLTERQRLPAARVDALSESLSLVVSGVLITVYLANLVYTLVTHRDVFAGCTEEDDSAGTWPLGKGLLVLCAATAGTALESELLSGALEETAGSLGLTPFFLGLIVLAVVGNAAEYISAIYFARRDRMGLALSITVGSSIQVALLLAPLLVIVSYLMGKPMNLVFGNPLELIAIAAVAFTVNAITEDGETTWFEGAMLLAVYAVLGTAFYFVR
jgi:Ca2+:H+ antiporter